MRGEGSRKDMDSGSIRQLREDLIQGAVGWPESGDAVTFRARKKELVSFINVDVFY